MRDYKIICPYCFKEFDHTKVHFRSEKANKGECEAIPDEYDDLDDFKARYRGNDKETILQKCRDWSFFQETDDPKYEKFWNDPNNGSVEPQSITRQMRSWVFWPTEERLLILRMQNISDI